MSTYDTPPSHQRPSGNAVQRLRERFSAMSKMARIGTAGAGGGVLIVAVVVVLLLTNAFASAGPRVPHHDPPPRSHHHHHGTTTTTSTRHHHANPDLCPLTGVRSGDGKVPQRPAIGIKIGNDPDARPQSGLSYADIVYEEMAEGGITRYLAVYQCDQAPSLGPVRSVRWDDWHVLASYEHPILAYSGGINQWEQIAAHLGWLYNADGSFYPMANAYFRTGNREPPENLYTTTARIWALDSSNHTPPQAQFQYRPQPAASAKPAAGVTIVGYSAGENVQWNWNNSLHAWDRSQGGVADVDASTGKQLHATNVVIQVVHTTNEPYYESGDVYGVESITEGSGVAYVFRNGKVEQGTWSTPKYGDTMRLRLSNGDLMSLQAGNTWVEEVPTGYAVDIQN